MSKGPGRLQRLILDSCDSSGEPLQQNRLIWKLAETEGQIIKTGTLSKDLEKGFIGDSFSKGIQRAIKELCGRSQVIQKKTKLLSLDQLVKYYPYKTNKYEILSLRKRLLSVTKEFVNERHQNLFGSVEAEVHWAKNLREADADKYRRAINDWQEIECQVLSVLSDVAEPLKTKLFALLVRGRQLLLDERAVYRKALNSIIKDLGKVDWLGSHKITLFEQLKYFYNTYLERPVRHNTMKGQIYSVAALGKGEKPRLKQEFKEYLLRKDPSFIRGLPGHKDGELVRKSFVMVNFGKVGETQFSGLLDKLIDRYAFSSFQFLQTKTR